MMEEDISESNKEEDISESNKRRLSKSKLFGGAAVLGGLGLTVYAFRDQFKKFMKWDEDTKTASEDSAVLLQGKLGLAKALCDVPEPKYADIQYALDVARTEARKLAKLNRQVQKRLASMGTIPNKLS